MIIAMFVVWAGPGVLLASDIEGEVRIASSSKFAARARVQLLRLRQVIEERFLDADGRFEFRNVGTGPFVVFVRLAGYVDEEVSLTIPVQNAREFLSITLHPVKGSAEAGSDTVSVAEYQIPREAKHEYEQGLRDRKRGNCAKAMPHFQQAITVYEKYGEAFNELGACFKETANFEKAEQSFQKAIQYDPTIYASMNLADLYAERKRFAEGEDILRQSLAKHPSEGDLYFGIARIRFDQGELGGAEQAALEAHSRLHRGADVHLLLAKIYLKLQRYSDLVSQLKTYLVENPKGPMADQVRKSLADVQKK